MRGGYRPLLGKPCWLWLALFSLSFSVLFPSSGRAAPIYVYREADGVVRFSTKPPPKGVKSEVFTSKGRFSFYSTTRSVRGRLFKTEYSALIAAAAKKHRVDQALIRAVIHVESAFNPRAVSPKSAKGLMQLIPENLRLLKVRNPFSPQENINAGVKFLARLIQRYPGNLKHALAAYNAGPGAVDRHGGIPPYRETQDYVRRVLALHSRYSRGF